MKNKIKIIKVLDDGNKHNKKYCIAECHCGKQFKPLLSNVKSNRTKSCGCSLSKASTTHGYSKTRLYSVWSNMLTRCNNPKKATYERYGGRGIKICDRWKKFENFLEDNKKMYNVAFKKYGKETQIDRIDNDGDYTPENCRWISRTMNSNNRSTNVLLTYKNKQYTLSALARKHKLHPETFRSRLERGCEIEQALTTPLFCRKHLVSLKNTAR